jgi:hypothetical protein
MIKKLLMVVVVVAILSGLAVASFDLVQVVYAQELTDNGRGGKSIPSSWQQGQVVTSELTSLPAATVGELDTAEKEALLYMREEEKLAQDVYAVLYAKWGLPVFQNISQSEQTHTSAVKVLLDRYGVKDPASTTPGVFTNPDLQKLYQTLAARGTQSIGEALKVGAEIEEIDILDLKQRLAQTDQADIQQVFTNLGNASNNHLRSFVTNLKTQTGETYQPQHLDKTTYDSILNGANGRGGNGGGTGQGGNGGRGGKGGGRGGNN